MPSLAGVLSVLAQGLDTTANVMGVVMPGPEQPAPKKRKAAEGCTPCEAKAKARAYLYGQEPAPPPPRRTVGRAEPAPRAGLRPPVKTGGKKPAAPARGRHP